MCTDHEDAFDGEPAFYAASVDDWRAWLETNCESAPAVWLIVYNKGSHTPSALFDDLVEHALCYGWIDSKGVKRDAESSYFRFSPRNPKSTWSNRNRERVERLTSAGLMTPHGRALVDLARTTGTWESLADAQNAVVPDDLQRLFDEDEQALANFQAFPPSSRRLILEWIATAKRPETRARRIIETVDLARDNIRAHHAALARALRFRPAVGGCRRGGRGGSTERRRAPTVQGDSRPKSWGGDLGACVPGEQRRSLATR